MAFDDLKAELALLINQMENQPEDPHELYLQIREKLNEMRAFGMPLPADLVAFEKDLEAQFAATKRAGAKAAPKSVRKSPTESSPRKAAKPKLLSGGNPQIAKADGDAPVQAYIAAMPGWKRDVGRKLDALIERSVPNVRKAVKWNSPFYGVEGQGFFLGIHSFTRYVKVAFFRGASLRPLPPGASKSKDTRYLDIREGDEIDEAQMANWVKQAAALPGFTIMPHHFWRA